MSKTNYQLNDLRCHLNTNQMRQVDVLKTKLLNLIIRLIIIFFFKLLIKIKGKFLLQYWYDGLFNGWF